MAKKKVHKPKSQPKRTKKDDSSQFIFVIAIGLLLLLIFYLLQK